MGHTKTASWRNVGSASPTQNLARPVPRFGRQTRREVRAHKDRVVMGGGTPYPIRLLRLT